MVNFSENILVLEAGGSLAFAGPTDEWKKEKQAHQEFSLPEDEPVVAEDQPKTESKKPEEPEDENEKMRRQIGDSTLWLYYLKSFGLSNLILVLLLNFTSSLGSNFPRKDTSICPISR
jgi:hypothetical protein